MIGQTLNNRYKITERLGKGAMGVVYRATDTQNGKEVALKVIVSDLMIESDMLERFKREGEALSKLKHPNIVEFLDAFESEENYVIVMEYISGGSLHDLIKKGALPIGDANRITLGLCDALIRSHNLGIIHRDLKPENILLTEDGTPKLADFGVARLNEGTRMTRSGTQVGTPYYMAPEAWEGKTLGAQADIWSLGVVLFEMLTGKVPFGGDTGAAVMNKVLTTNPPNLKTLRNEVPPGMGKIVSRMLTRDKKRRYQSMREVAVELEQSQQSPSIEKSLFRNNSLARVMYLGLMIVGGFVLYQWAQQYEIVKSITTTTATSNIAITETSDPKVVSPSTATATEIKVTATPVCSRGSSVNSETLAKAESFSSPILASLIDIEPTFQDDFSTSGNGWKENRVAGAWEAGTMEIVDGVLRFSGVVGQNLSDTGSWSFVQDFVFEVDQSLIEGFNSTEQRITFHLHQTDSINYATFSIQVYQKAGYWTFRKSSFDSGDDIAEGRCGLNPVPESNRFTLIVQQNEFALLINGTPVYYLQDDTLIEPGWMHLLCWSPAAAVCEWDNVKFWKLN